MYDEGFNEAAVLQLRGCDLLAEAHRRLKPTHGKELAAEIRGAMHARKAAQHATQTQAAPTPDYGTAEVPFGSFPPRDVVPGVCVFVDTAGVGKVVLESLQRLGVKARPLPKVALSEPPLRNAERIELQQWRSMFSRPDICGRTLDQLREAHDELQRRLETVRGAVLK